MSAACPPAREGAAEGSLDLRKGPTHAAIVYDLPSEARFAPGTWRGGILAH